MRRGKNDATKKREDTEDAYEIGESNQGDNLLMEGTLNS